MTQTTWATVTDVADITGTTVDDNVLRVANYVVSTHARRLYELDADRVSTRDAVWLKHAVSWQAAWLPDQPDFQTRMNIREISEAGRSTTLDATALELAPMAKRNLNNCSFRRTRSLHVRSPFVDGATPISANALAEANDPYEQWRPL
jgi:hypothetical protein